MLTRWTVFSLLALAILLAACTTAAPTIQVDSQPALTRTGTPTSTPSPPTGSEATGPMRVPLLTPDTRDLVVITFACSSHELEHYEDLASAFHAHNPGIRVQIVAYEESVDLSTGISSVQESTYSLVSGADTALWMVAPEATRAGLLRDLTPFLAADLTFEPDDFFPHMLEAFQWEGGTWALPSEAVPTVIFYDKAAFEAAGIPYPQPGWTEDDFLALAQELTVRTGDGVERYGYVNLFGGLVEAFALGPSGAMGQDEPALDSPAVAESVRWVTDLALRYEVMPNPWVPPPPPDGPWAAAQALVDNDRAAMWSDNLGNYENRSRSFELGVVSFPQTGGQSTPAWMNGYIMSAGTRHPQEAWHWLNFLTRQRIASSDQNSVPARRSVAEQTRYWAQFDPAMEPVVRYAADHLLFPVWTDSARELSQAVRRVFEGQTVEAALAEAQMTAVERVAERAMTQATPMPVAVATPRPEGSSGAVTITFAPPPGTSVATYRALAETFNQGQTAVEVQVVSSDQAQRADCFARGPSVAEPSVRASTLNLQPLLDADDDFSLDDFHSRFLEAFRYEGNLWGLPTQAQVRVLFYNRDLFDAAGVSYPAAGWTLDDFVARAVALTTGDGDDKQYGFLPLNGDASDLPAFVALQGAALWDEEGRPRFDASEVVAAVRWYTDLALKHGVMPAFPDDVPDPDPAAQQARQALVRAGRVAMWTDFSGLDRSSVWPLDAAVGMAPLPREADGVTDFLYEGLFIGADAPYPEACWEWLKFVSERAEPVGQLPARRSLLDSDIFAQEVGDEAVETYRALLEYDDLYRPTTVEAGSQIQWLYQAVADIWAGARPEAALAEAQREATR